MGVHFASTSHGTQVLAGLNYIEETIDSKYAVVMEMYSDGPGLPPTIMPAMQISHQAAYPGDYWASEDGIAKVVSFMDSGLYDISGFFWCGELNNASTEYVQQYLDTMEFFEGMYPDIHFVYTTGITNGGWPIWLRNTEMIRTYCLQNDKILFDFADIESWDPTGVYYPETDDSCPWCYEWCAEHAEDCINLLERCEAGLETCCAHSHGYNCYIKAKAFWWMAARLAGWNGCPAIPGDVNGDCQVDIVDCQTLTDAWMFKSGDPNWNPACDIAPLGGDGTIDSQDFSVLSTYWMQRSCLNPSPISDPQHRNSKNQHQIFALHELVYVSIHIITPYFESVYYVRILISSIFGVNLTPSLFEEAFE